MFSGCIAAVYTAVRDPISSGSSFRGWSGTNFTLDGDRAIIYEGGSLHKGFNGCNYNEAWLLSCQAEDSDALLRLSFADKHKNLIKTVSAVVKTKATSYFSVYGVAPAHAQWMLLRIEGSATVHDMNLRQLKPKMILRNCDIELAKRKDNFSNKRDLLLKGRAKNASILDSVDFDAFGETPKRLLVFMDDNPMFSHIEAKLDSMNPVPKADAGGPVSFRAIDVKIPVEDWL